MKNAGKTASGPSLPRVSVALATYNGEQFLMEQLDSLADQTLLPLELVISDDGSTDKTVGIVRQFAARAPFSVKLLEGGRRLNYRGNFRRAAAHCSGDLIAFCDQDDVWVPHKLEKMTQVFSDPKVQLAYHNAVVSGPEGTRMLYAAEEEQAAVRVQPMAPFKSPNGLVMLFRADLRRFDDLWDNTIDQNEGDTVLAHDQWYFFLARALGEVRFIDEPLVLYRQHAGNTLGVLTKLDLLRRISRRFIHFGTADEWAARSADSRAAVLKIMQNREAETRLGQVADSYAQLAMRRRRRAAIYCKKTARGRFAALVRCLAARDYQGGGWAFRPASVIRDLWSGAVRGRCVDPTRASKCERSPTATVSVELTMWPDGSEKGLVSRGQRVAGSMESERIRSAAAARTVAQLISRQFDAPAVDPSEIDAEVAHEIIRIGEANKILKPLLKGFEDLQVPIPDDAKPTIAIYSRKALKNNAAALATLREVARKLSAAGIVHAAFKGPVRQIALRQDVFERPVADVDILVRRGDFALATDVLKEMGYWIPLFCDSPWWRHYLGEHPLLPNGRNRLGVDLHHRTQHPSCPRPRNQESLLDDLEWADIGGEKIPIFGAVAIFLNTIMSIVKGLANREPTGGHVLDLARQLNAADDRRLAEFERAARDQKLEKSYAVAKRAVLVLTGVARGPVAPWFVPDEALLAMLLTPEDPGIKWPRHTKLLWKLVDGKSRLGRAVKFTRELAWWTAAEFTRRTHDVSQMPARAEPNVAAATPA